MQDITLQNPFMQLSYAAVSTCVDILGDTLLAFYWRRYRRRFRLGLLSYRSPRLRQSPNSRTHRYRTVVASALPRCVRSTFERVHDRRFTTRFLCTFSPPP